MASGKQLIEILAKRISAQGFDRVLSKVKVLSGGHGKCTAELKIEEEHQNAGGTLHGGMTATMVDIISTLALMTHENSAPGVSVDLHVSYLKAAKVGEDIILEASTIRKGKNLAYLHVDIKNKITNEVIARGSHTKFLGSSGTKFDTRP